MNFLRTNVLWPFDELSCQQGQPVAPVRLRPLLLTAWPGRQLVSFPPITTSVCCSWKPLVPLRVHAFPQNRTSLFFVCLAHLWRWQKSLLYHVCLGPLGRPEPSSGFRLSQALADPPYGFDWLWDVCVGVGWIVRRQALALVGAKLELTHHLASILTMGCLRWLVGSS